MGFSFIEYLVVKREMVYNWLSLGYEELISKEVDFCVEDFYRVFSLGKMFCYFDSGI